jgi:hypothetical protein
LQVLIEESLRQCGVEHPELLPNDQVKEITQEWAVLDRSGKKGMVDCQAGAITNQPPKVRFHQCKPLVNQSCDSNGCTRVASLEHILLHDGFMPLIATDASE